MTYREKLRELHPDWEQSQLDEAYDKQCPDNFIENADIPKYESGTWWCGDSRCRDCWDREIPDTNSNGCITTTNENEPTTSHYVQNEKEKNMATTKKTKSELMEELETVKASKEELEKELKNLEKYKQYEDMAGEIHALYMSFVMAGFSEEQAYDLLKTMIMNAGQININAAVQPSYAGYRCKK